jgi:hypothetical protein
MAETNETFGILSPSDGYIGVTADLILPGNNYRVGKEDYSYFNFYLGFNANASTDKKKTKIIPVIEAGVSFADTKNKHGWAAFYNTGEELCGSSRSPYEMFNWLENVAGLVGLRKVINLKLELREGTACLSVSGTALRPFELPQKQTQGYFKLAMGVSDSRSKPQVTLDRVSFSNIKVLSNGEKDYKSLTTNTGFVNIGGGRTGRFKILSQFPPSMSYGG